jgi:hypothetical protein
MDESTKKWQGTERFMCEHCHGEYGAWVRSSHESECMMKKHVDRIAAVEQEIRDIRRILEQTVAKQGVVE